jgi:very-short-patch-repair endonuclease
MRRLEKVSPPFEGGVAGTIDYLIFTRSISRPGWLILSLDGYHHGEYHNIQKDENWDKYLESLGFTVLKLENKFVFQEPEFVKDKLREVINDKKETS